jgi:antitoxin component YwqK of YwqJK toxin-antitoxin module
LKVVLIFDVENPNSRINSIPTNYIEKEYTKQYTKEYKEGEIISDEFETNLNKIFGKGIYYFKKIDAVIYQMEKVPSTFSGTWTKFDEYGAKRFETNYLHGKMHGKRIEYNYSGVKVHESEYFNGELNGSYYFWYDNGNSEVEGKYVKNKMTGHWVNKYKNGNKSSEGNYDKNHKSGKWIYYHQDGKEKNIIDYSTK